MATQDDKAQAWWEEAKDRVEEIGDKAENTFHETKGRLKQRRDDNKQADKS